MLPLCLRLVFLLFLGLILTQKNQAVAENREREKAHKRKGKREDGPDREY